MKTHKTMSGLELLTVAVQKVLKPRALNLTELHNKELKRQSYERTQQEKRSKETKEG